MNFYTVERVFANACDEDICNGKWYMYSVYNDLVMSGVVSARTSD